MTQRKAVSYLSFQFGSNTQTLLPLSALRMALIKCYSLIGNYRNPAPWTDSSLSSYTSKRPPA